VAASCQAIADKIVDVASRAEVQGLCRQLCFRNSGIKSKGRLEMKRQINPTIKAYLVGGAFYVLLFLAVYAIPFALALAQRPTAKANRPATTITVTNGNDGGSGSLRQALADANDGDTINFDASVGIVILTTAELAIDKSLTLSGAPQMVTVERVSQTEFRIFNVMSGHSVEIDGLTITGGSLVGNGGGISSSAILTISNCAISGNSITAGDVAYGGAGIYNVGTMTIVNSIVNNNQGLIAGFFPPLGGGILNDGGTLTIQNTTINENTMPGGGEGGGVYNAVHAGGSNRADPRGGSLTAINSTIRGNNGASTGGGIFGEATLINCTISGNSAVFEGGGIFLDGGTISNCTISGNMTTVGHSRGGGISGAGIITNSTFSDNLSINGSGICALGAVELGDTILSSGASIFVLGGTVTSRGYNLSYDDGGGFLTGPGDQINTDPLLGPLQDNGGPTFTHALLVGSPAIDMGDPNFTPPPDYDQRGPVYWRVRNGHIDVGSFEVQTGEPTATPTATASPTPTPTATATPTATPTFTPTATATFTPTSTPTTTPPPTPTSTPTATTTITPRPTPTPRQHATPRVRPTPPARP